MQMETAVRLFRQREHYFSLSDRLFMSTFPYLSNPSPKEITYYNNLIQNLIPLKNAPPIKRTLRGTALRKPMRVLPITDTLNIIDLENEGIEDGLTEYAKDYPVLLGGYLLTTSHSFLQAVAAKESAILIIQNYDLVHDTSSPLTQSYSNLHNKMTYKTLTGKTNTQFGTVPLAPLNLHGPLLQFSADGGASLYHPKYLIFGIIIQGRFVAKAVALGSYNTTERAKKSVEHATIFEHEELATLYLQRFVRELEQTTPWP